MSNITFASPGNFDNTLISSNFFTQAYGLSDDHTTRLNKYQLCWDFYMGKHWSKKAPEGFDQITINYTKAFAKKLRRFSFRNDWTIVHSEETMSEETAEYIREVWEQNDLHDTTTKISDFGGIFGDWYVYVQWIPPEEGTKDKGYIRLSVLDPRYVFPDYNTLTGEMDFCLVLVPYEQRSYNGREIETEMRLHREIHTKDKIYISRYNSENQVIEEQTMDNPINKILIVHGINQYVAGSNFGCSDIEDIIDPQKLLNEKVSDISDIIDYHAAPITIMYGAKSKQLEKGANKLWSGLPINARVENLKSEGNVDASMNFIAFIKKSMHEISSITQDALGAEREISNTSAVALSLDFEPLIEVAEDKRFYQEKGLRKINEIIIDIAESKNILKTKSNGPQTKYRHDIEYGDLLPRDRSITLDEVEAEIRMNLESRTGALKRLGVKEPDKKITEVDEEAISDAERDAKVMEIKTPPEAQNPQATESKATAKKANSSNPVIHGEQVTKQNVKDKS